jgi:dihydroorotate dehydrogenase (NAD+) catalytic subunit
VSSDVRKVDAPGRRVVDARAIDPAEVDLSTELAGVPLANPVLSASGCFASGVEVDRFFDVTELGAIVVKSITREPREGLPTPRMAETPSGMLNAIGLQNPGIDAWLAHDLPWLQGRGASGGRLDRREDGRRLPRGGPPPAPGRQASSRSR